MTHYGSFVLYIFRPRLLKQIFGTIWADRRACLGVKGYRETHVRCRHERKVGSRNPWTFLPACHAVHIAPFLGHGAILLKF